MTLVIGALFLRDTGASTSGMRPPLGYIPRHRPASLSVSSMQADWLHTSP